MFAPDAIEWDDAAVAAEEVAFRWTRQDEGAHYGAVEIGRLTSLARDGDRIRVTGWVDDEWEGGADWVAMAVEAGSMGVSIDGDDYEVQLIDTTIEEAEGQEGGVLLLYGADTARVAAAGDPDPGQDGGVLLVEAAAGDILERYTRMRVRALTSVDIPAFDEARVSLDTPGEVAAEEDDTEGQDDADALAAASGHGDCGCGGACGDCGDRVVAAGHPAAPVQPPRVWFERDSDLMDRYRQQAASDEFGSIRVTDDGRVYGYVAAWGVCHTGYHGECVLTPRTSTQYGHYRTGYVVCDDGSEVATGPISMGGGHADLRLSGAGAIEHYDQTSAAVADVACGEDEFGIWFAGALRPGITPEQVRELRGSALSGDWRPYRSALEMVAALAVNSPGFPIPRARVASGRVQALVAAGAGLVHRQAQQDPDANLLARLEVLEGVVADSARTRLAGHARRMLVGAAR